MTAQEFYDSLFTEHSKPAESGRVSANLQRKVLEAKLRVTIYILYTMRNPHLQEETEKLLLCGEGADEYYDLFNRVMEFVDKAGSSSSSFLKLKEHFNRFYSKVSEQVYCKVMREFSLRHYDREGSLFSWVSMLHLLIIEWYQRGMQSAGWEGCRVSISSVADVTLLELFVLVMEKNQESSEYFPVRDKDWKAVKSLLTLLNDKTIVRACAGFLCFLDKFNLLTNFVYTCSYSAFINLYSNHPQPNFCVQFASIKWRDVEEEGLELTRGSLALILEEAGMELLQHRRLLLNGEGVTLQFRKPFGLVTEVHLYEVHQDNLHYIYLRYRIKQGMYREFLLNIEDITCSFYWFLYEMDYNLTIGILCWMGLQELLLQGIDSLKERYHPIKEGLKRWVQDIADSFKEENLIYCEPSWWNYKSTKSNSTKHLVEYSKLVQIATYSRRLPEGQQASESAKALAKKYCMVLEPGYTLVGGFERKQRVKKQVV